MPTLAGGGGGGGEGSGGGGGGGGMDGGRIGGTTVTFGRGSTEQTGLPLTLVQTVPVPLLQKLSRNSSVPLTKVKRAPRGPAASISLKRAVCTVRLPR